MNQTHRTALAAGAFLLIVANVIAVKRCAGGAGRGRAAQSRVLICIFKIQKTLCEIV